MNAADLESLERDLSHAAQTLSYPPTPAIAAAIMPRLRPRTRQRLIPRPWAWALVGVVVLLSALMFVPGARAAIVDFIQVGVVRILRGPNPAPQPAPTAGSGQVPLQMPSTATPALEMQPTTTAAPAFTDLAGETTLSEARRKATFTVLLPSYPSDLGAPDRVYVQELGSPMLILVWLEHGSSGRVHMSLDEIAPGNWAIEKFSPPVIENVQVNGRPAVWTEGPYIVQARNGTYETRSLVGGHVLVWTEAEITCRLETDLPLEEAIKIAESLVPSK